MASLAIAVLASILLLNLKPGGLPTVRATAQSTGFAYFPDHYDVVVHLNVNRVINSPLLSRLISDPASLQKLDRAVREIGLDPRSDISEVLIGGNTQKKEMPVVFLRGPQLRDKVAVLLNRKPELLAKRDNYKGYELMLRANGDARQPAAAFFDESLLAVSGERRALESAIDVRLGVSPSIFHNNPMMNLISHINQTEPIWLAVANGRLNLPPNPAWSASPLAQAKIRSLTVYGNLDMAVSGKIIGFFDDAQTAKNFSAMGRGLLAFGKMQAAQQAEALQLLDGLSFDEYQNQVILNVQLPFLEVERLMNNHRSFLNMR